MYRQIDNSSLFCEHVIKRTLFLFILLVGFILSGKRYLSLVVANTPRLCAIRETGYVNRISELKEVTNSTCQMHVWNGVILYLEFTFVSSRFSTFFIRWNLVKVCAFHFLHTTLAFCSRCNLNFVICQRTWMPLQEVYCNSLYSVQQPQHHSALRLYKTSVWSGVLLRIKSSSCPHISFSDSEV